MYNAFEAALQQRRAAAQQQQQDSDTHCHCGRKWRRYDSDHCASCYCERHEATCDHVHVDGDDVV